MSMAALSVVLTSNLKMSRHFYRGLTVSSFRTIYIRPCCAISPAVKPYCQTVTGNNHVKYRAAISRPVSSDVFRTQLQFSLNPTSDYIQRCNVSTTPFCSSPNKNQLYDQNRTTLKYIVAIAIFVVGLSYAAVPLYRVFCQASGYGGTVTLTEASEKVEKMEAVRERELTIR